MPISFTSKIPQLSFTSRIKHFNFNFNNHSKIPKPEPFNTVSEDVLALVIKYGHKTESGDFAIWRNGQEEIWWHIGDTRPVTLSDGQATNLRIIGFEFDDMADGGGKAKITCDFVNLLDVGTAPDSAASYLEMEYRTAVLALKDKLPQYLQNLMVPCVKYSNNIPFYDDITLFMYSNIHVGAVDFYPFFVGGSIAIKRRKATTGGTNTSYITCTNGDNNNYWAVRASGALYQLNLPAAALGTYAAPIIFLHSN